MSVISEGETFACVGYDGSKQLELSVDSTKKLSIGNAFSGIGIRTPKAPDVFSSAQENGGSVEVELSDFAYAASQIPDEDEMKSFPVRYGRLSDPDGYSVEVHEGAEQSITKAVLNVLDLEQSIGFYENLGLCLLRKRSNVMSKPKEASICAYMGDTSEGKAYIELVYKYATTKLDLGNGFLELTIKGGREGETLDPNGYSISFS